MRTPVVALLCLAVSMCSGMAEPFWDRQERREAKLGTGAFTLKLPQVDAIVLHRYRPWPTELNGVPAVGDIRFEGSYAGSRRVHASSVDKLCNLWRRQRWDLKFAEPSHLPDYAITFRRNGQLVCTVSISFEEQSVIVFEEPGEQEAGVDLAKRRQGFSVESRQGRALRRIFAEAFPD